MATYRLWRRAFNQLCLSFASEADRTACVNSLLRPLYSTVNFTTTNATRWLSGVPQYADASKHLLITFESLDASIDFLRIALVDQNLKLSVTS